MDLDAKSATETNQTSGYSGSNSESPIFSTHTAYSETPLVRHGNTPSSPVDSAGPRPAIVEEEPDKVRGWPRLAQKMAEKRGLESFARFRELNIKNLFYYQAELATLQCQLKFIEDDDAGKYTYAKDAGELMCPLDATEEPQAREQRDLVLKIRTLLKDYSKSLRLPPLPPLAPLPRLTNYMRTKLLLLDEAFCLYRQMSEAPAPDPRNVETVHAWLTRHDLGGNCIGGMGSDTWGKPYGAGPEEQTIARRLLLLPFRLFWPRQFAEVDKLDLVTVPPRQKPDAFVNWISHEFVPLYHDIVGYLRPSSPQEDEETAQDRADRKKKEKERRERKKKERREQEQKEKERRKNDGFVCWALPSITPVDTIS